jgi:hypothetical protein
MTSRRRTRSGDPLQVRAASGDGSDTPERSLLLLAQLATALNIGATLALAVHLLTAQ